MTARPLFSASNSSELLPTSSMPTRRRKRTLASSSWTQPLTTLTTSSTSSSSWKDKPDKYHKYSNKWNIGSILPSFLFSSSKSTKKGKVLVGLFLLLIQCCWVVGFLFFFNDGGEDGGSLFLSRRTPLDYNRSQQRRTTSTTTTTTITSTQQQQQQQPLDNYMTRPHWTPTNHPHNNHNTDPNDHDHNHNDDDDDDDDDLPVLVVGGSDGSGTRAFVEILGHLGVPMLVDDTGTGDIHASGLFDGEGWPGLVRLVLSSLNRPPSRPSRNSTSSTSTTTPFLTLANYTFDDLPFMTRTLIRSTLQPFLHLHNQRGRKLRHEGLRVNMSLAQNVLYGFKAPVSLLLLPILFQPNVSYPKLKFIHVVRDGRDVALSDNQSPVEKFYHAFYHSNTTTTTTNTTTDPNETASSSSSSKEDDDVNVQQTKKALQLWNDWNVQVYEWEQEQSQKNPNTFDYLLVRTEDLVNPTTRLTTIQQLAHFVGSPKLQPNADLSLCCLSHFAMKDLGESSVKTTTENKNKNHRHRHDPYRHQETWLESITWGLYRGWKIVLYLLGLDDDEPSRHLPPPPPPPRVFGETPVDSQSFPHNWAAARRRQQQQQQRLVVENPPTQNAQWSSWNEQQQQQEEEEEISDESPALRIRRPDLFQRIHEKRAQIQQKMHLFERAVRGEEFEAAAAAEEEEEEMGDPDENDNDSEEEEEHWGYIPEPRRLQDEAEEVSLPAEGFEDSTHMWMPLRRVDNERLPPPLRGGSSSHGDAAVRHVPWRGGGTARNQVPRPVVPVDHWKYDTMLERVKEAELEQKYMRFQRQILERQRRRQGNDAPAAAETPEQVMQRYGKWKRAVEDHPALGSLFAAQGIAQEGLRVFGYEPAGGVPFSDFPSAGVCELPPNCPSYYSNTGGNGNGNGNGGDTSPR